MSFEWHTAQSIVLPWHWRLHGCACTLQSDTQMKHWKTECIPPVHKWEMNMDIQLILVVKHYSYCNHKRICWNSHNGNMVTEHIGDQTWPLMWVIRWSIGDEDRKTHNVTHQSIVMIWFCHKHPDAPKDSTYVQWWFPLSLEKIPNSGSSGKRNLPTTCLQLFCLFY